MSVVPEIPEKPFFRINEVCELTDTQPYVLQFWESEFPQLSPDQARGGKPLYKKHDVELVLRIKHLLYEEEYTIAGARQRLSEEGTTDSEPEVAFVSEPRQPAAEQPRQLELDAEPPARPTTVERSDFEEESQGGVSRKRYDRAVEEITHLRLLLADFENRQRRIDGEHAQAVAEVARLRDRSDRAAGRLDAILGKLQA